MKFREIKFDNQMCEGYQTHYTIDVIKEINSKKIYLKIHDRARRRESELIPLDEDGLIDINSLFK